MANLTTTNQINSGSLESLIQNDTLLVQAWKTTNPEMVQLEFAEKKSANQTSSVLSLLNESNPAFQRKGTRCWLSVHIDDVDKHLGLDVSPSNSGWDFDDKRQKECLTLNVLNPVKISDGPYQTERFRVRVAETIDVEEADSYDVENELFKINPSTKTAITHKGRKIYVNKFILFQSEFDKNKDIKLPADNNENGTKATSSVAEEDVRIDMPTM